MPVGVIVHSDAEKKLVSARKERLVAVIENISLIVCCSSSSSEWLTTKQRLRKRYTILGWIASLVVVGLYVVILRPRRWRSD